MHRRDNIYISCAVLRRDFYVRASRRHGQQAGRKYLQRASTNRSFTLERGSGYPFVVCGAVTEVRGGKRGK